MSWSVSVQTNVQAVLALSHSELLVVKDSDAVALEAGIPFLCERVCVCQPYGPVSRSLLEQAQGGLDYRRTEAVPK